MMFNHLLTTYCYMCGDVLSQTGNPETCTSETQMGTVGDSCASRLLGTYERWSKRIRTQSP